MKSLYLLVLLLNMQLVSAQSGSVEFRLPQVNNHWLRAAPPNAKMLAAYASITNTTEHDLKLIGAYAPDFKLAEIHKTVEVDGMLKMREQKELALPEKSNLVMEPGGVHIMLMMPNKKFKVGEDVRICLVYEDGTGAEYVQHLDFPVMKK